MADPVVLPFWLFLMMLAAAIAAIWQHFLFPGFRYMLRTRVNRVIDEVNTRLNIGIRPFQLTKRAVLIDRLVFDSRVIEAIESQAKETRAPRLALQAEVRRYAHEIVPAFNAYVYFRIGYWLANRFARLMYRIRVGFPDESRLSGIDPEATVVFVMNHRSNMDYVLVGLLASEHTALSYAVGEWARVWPLQQLIRAMGAFFVRRNSNNPLYRRVLERYVYMATQEGVPQAVFLEGGLSKDGKLRAAKLGMLDYMLRGYDCEHSRDIVFVPVGVNYDRVLEDRTLVRALDPSAPRRSRWFVLRTTFSFIGHNFWLMMRSRWQRFGFAAVNYGRPFSMREYCQHRQLNFSRLPQSVRFAEIETLGIELMKAIQRHIPAVPIPLVASSLLNSGHEGLDELALKAAFYRHVEEQRQGGRMVVAPVRTQEHVFDTALHMLQLRHMVIEKGGVYYPEPSARDMLAYYANSISPR